MNGYVKVECSPRLSGEVELVGAKNAVLVIMASLILTEGRSTLKNVPNSADVLQMIRLLRNLGADVKFDSSAHNLTVDTRCLKKFNVCKDIMKQMRASILVLGPLLVRFSRADMALPGGCVIGCRPINYHLRNLRKMGADIKIEGERLFACVTKLQARRLVLEYPSVGATENCLMAALGAEGTSHIVNAALEPEVLDLIAVLQKMGAHIRIESASTLAIEGGHTLKPIEHTIVNDRLEAGSLMLAAAITGGSLYLPQACAYHLDVFLLKLQEMGHSIRVGRNGIGIHFSATLAPRVVSFKTAPYPGFPTDLQAPMMAAQCLASGRCVVEEAVFENRMAHCAQLNKLGARIQVEGNRAIITGVDELCGTSLVASDIRGGCALLLAGLAAKGITTISGIHHIRRGYDAIQKKMKAMGASIEYIENDTTIKPAEKIDECKHCSSKFPDGLQKVL